MITADEVITALDSVTASLEDMVNGWSEDELHEPVEVSIRRARDLLAKMEDGIFTINEVE